LISFFTALFGWLPPALQIIAIGVVAIFFVLTILRLIAFILDVIPFL
jgi:hypothetical protein